MCGILGQISHESNLPLPDITLLKHRGPDSFGEWYNTSATIYFGHTRLAILDRTDAGNQPMKDSLRRFTIIFNGEIYNHLELRKSLPNFLWQGNSDTETVIELFSAFGLQSLYKLKGMFALAIHDCFDDSVLLIRDRLGIKPLYLQKEAGFYRFSSEIKAFDDIQASFTKEALSEYLAFGRMPEYKPILGNIEPIAPGTWVRITKEKTTEKGILWTPSSWIKKYPIRKIENIQKVNQLVSKAIEEHLISDVGVGAFLSGGIDSSIIVLEAGKNLGKRLETFTVGFPQASFDERVIARKVAKLAGSQHSEIEVDYSTCQEWVMEAVMNLDLPSIDAINTYIVSKAVSNKGIKVVLSGLGGDELFGGYPSFNTVPWLNLLNNLPYAVRSSLVKLLPKQIYEKLSGINSFSISDLTVARRRFMSTTSLRNLKLTNGTPTIPICSENLDTIGQISWAELHGYTIPMLLRDSDQMSMAVSLEIRVPFLDHELVEYILKLPDYYKKGKGIKPLLVSAFQTQLPREVYDRPKQGFSLPMENWLLDPLSDFLHQGILYASTYLHLKEPLIKLDQFKHTKLHWTRVWSWCVLGYWLNKKHVLIKEKNLIH